MRSFFSHSKVAFESSPVKGQLHLFTTAKYQQIFIAIAFYIVAGLLVLNNRFNWFDDAYYIMLAQALADGQGYVDVNLPTPQIHKLFPPMLSIFLALPSWFNLALDTKIIIFKVILIIFGATGLYVFTKLAAKEGHSSKTITYSIIISATSIALVGHTCRVASETAYLLFSILALISLSIYQEKKNLSRYLFISAVLLVICILTRSIGILLLPAIAVSWIIRREFTKVFLLVSLVILLLSPWLLLAKQTGGGGTSRYLTDMIVQYTNIDSAAEKSLAKALVNRAKENAQLIVSKEIPRIIFSLSASSTVLENQTLNLLSYPIRLFISLLVILSILASLWPKPKITTFYLVFYLGLLLVWPWEPSRFLIPIIPFLCLAFFNSLEKLLDSLATKLQIKNGLATNLINILVILLVISHLISDARFITTVWRTGDFSPQAAEFGEDTVTAYKWVKENTPKDSLMGCIPALEAYAYIYCQRKAVALPTNPEVCQQLNVSYIIFIDEKLVNNNQEAQSARDLRHFLKRAGGDNFLSLVYQNKTVKIFSIDHTRLAELLSSQP